MVINPLIAVFGMTLLFLVARSFRTLLRVPKADAFTRWGLLVFVLSITVIGLGALIFGTFGDQIIMYVSFALYR